MVNIGSTATGAKVIAVKGDAAKLSLTGPACTELGEKIALSRRIESESAGLHYCPLQIANDSCDRTLETYRMGYHHGWRSR